MSEETAKPQENEKLTTALREILSNPQMLSTIASMAQSLKSSSIPQVSAPAEKIPEESKSDVTENKTSESEAPAALPAGLTELLGSLSNGNAGRSRQSELLCALKPYLSQNRADAIDKMIRFSELSSLFKGLS